MRDAHLERLARWRVPLGFAVIVPYLYFAQPSLLSLATGAAIAAAGVGLRAVAAGYLRKGEALATAGPYAYVRHPLYLGSVFLVVGFGVAGGRVWLGLMLAAVFVGLYLPVLLREEAELGTRFSTAYEAYAAVVPRLVPRFRRRVQPQGQQSFSWALYRQNREYNAFLGYLVLLVLLYVRMRYAR